MTRRAGILFLLIVLLARASPLFAVSVITSRPDDPGAVYLTAEGFGVRGDGTSDDSGAVQAAVDKAGSSFNGGIVFVPTGRFRLTRTIHVWRGVRLIGYGATRPVFVLADDTPGFQTGIGVMVMFSDARAGTQAGRGRVPFPPPGSVPPADHIGDANQSTASSPISSISTPTTTRRWRRCSRAR